MSDIHSAFEERFAGRPAFLAWAPGRVNLIGEHTDYNDLPVLPMALQRQARVALRPRDDGIVALHSTNPAFPPIEFDVRPGIPPDAPGAWSNYARAAADALARRFAIWRGFEGVLDSDVPVAAGLSSSSALVNAVGLALAHINEVPIEPHAFAALMAEAERFTGTRGGGMDQTVSLNARAGHAVKITFTPLRLQNVLIPEEWCFVVADSGVRVEKSGAAQKSYNLRRSECERAFAEVVEKVVGASLARTTPAHYPDLVRAVEHGELLALAERALEATLYRRFRHVITEARRVEEAVDRMRSADIAGFGTLMDASHGSLRTDFSMSSRELDDLVAIAREGGAAGARLTGAGLGGCIVALTDRASARGVVEALVADYFKPRKLLDRIEERVFIAIASEGAGFRPTS